MVLVARALEAMGKQSAVELEDTRFAEGTQEARYRALCTVCVIGPWRLSVVHILVVMGVYRNGTGAQSNPIITTSFYSQVLAGRGF
jgi:hypothetical protein